MSNDGLATTTNGEEEAPDGHPCICGFNGPIANHLRVYCQCLQVLKEQVGIGAEMPDEEFCVRAALLVGQCPAFCCLQVDHSEIPDICVQWWKSTGWKIMKWEGQGKDVSSTLIKKRSSQFVKELEANQMNQNGRGDKLNGSFLSHWKGDSEDRLIANSNEMASPSFSPQIPLQQNSKAASTNQNLPCRNTAEVEFQQTMEKAKAISRSEMPGCLHVTKLIPLGIRHAASLGILCRWSSLPINGNSMIPMNGNCIFTCFVHANNPSLRGAILEQAVWELRVRAVGNFIDRLQLFNDEQWSLLEAIVTGDGEVTPSRDEIRQEMEKYMESGEYTGNLGDIIINIAASFLQQPVLVIKVNDCKVTNSHWVDPNEMFGGRNHSLRCPIVVLSQLQHYESLLIANEAKDTAQMKYQQWKTSKRVCMSPGRQNLNDDLNPDAVHDVVGNFSPPFASTPQQQQHHGEPQQQHMADDVSNDFIDQEGLQNQGDTQQEGNAGGHPSIAKHLCICGYEGHLANHLRESNQCVAELRKEKLLHFQGSDELFVVKAVLTLRGCPVPVCPGGEHKTTIPVECADWWRGVGGKLMKWENFGADSSTEAVVQKINKFLKNSRQRRNKSLSNSKLLNSLTSSDPVSYEEEVDGCPVCHYQGSLAQHLHDCAPCLAALTEKYLQNRAAIYVRRTHLAIFDLGILLSFCPNPLCSTSLAKEGVQKHARGACLEFFQLEGESLYKWDKTLSSLSVAAKWKNRKSWLKGHKKQAAESQIGSYFASITTTLTGVCANCCVQGPLLGVKEHELEVVGWNETAERPLWLCGNCKNEKENHVEMVHFAEERVGAMSIAKPKDVIALKAVEVENQITGTSRVVFMPENVAGDEHPQVVRDELLPLSTTVLVPRNPESLDQFSDEVFDEANHDIDILSNLIQFLARRPFFVKPTLALSVFWRMKMAQIRLERLSMLKSLQKTSKGKIESRNPNIASVGDRDPHYAVTQKLCLTNTCSWSTGSEIKRSDESAARSYVNGQVKTKVRVTLLKQGEECPELSKILQEAIAVHGARPELYFAPLVMNFVYGKLKLLMKHILAPAYANWDLQLKFHSKEWTVQLAGYLYSHQYEEVNVKIAQAGLTHKDTIKYILSQKTLMPTVCLDASQLSEIYDLDQARAEVTQILS